MRGEFVNMLAEDLYVPDLPVVEDYGFFAPVEEDDVVRDVQELINAIVRSLME